MLRLLQRIQLPPTIHSARSTLASSSPRLCTTADGRPMSCAAMAEVKDNVHSAGAASDNVKKKVLLLLDVNGTLCYRSESRIPGVRWDLRFRKRYWYARKHLGACLRAVSGTDYYHICVYTSMMTHNARTGVNAIVPPQDRRLIHTVFDREYNKPDPEGATKWDTMRDMAKIWDSFASNSNDNVPYDATNTILVDNEARKFKETPRNGIIVPEFGAEEVISGDDDGLQMLARYLVHLADENLDGDVRDYMSLHPFSLGKAPIPGEIPLESLESLEAVTSKLQGMSVYGAPNKALDKLLDLPEGTTVHLKHIEGTYAVMKDEKSATSFKVKVRDGVRIESKMNLQRLIAVIGLESIVLS